MESAKREHLLSSLQPQTILFYMWQYFKQLNLITLICCNTHIVRGLQMFSLGNPTFLAVFAGVQIEVAQADIVKVLRNTKASV